MIDTIILDLDGPLLDGIDRHYLCYHRILQERGFRPLPQAEYWNLKRQQCSQADILRRSNAECVSAEFMGEWLRLIESSEILAQDRVQPGAIDTLRSWRSSGMFLILATMRNNPANTMRQLEETRLLGYLNEICITGTHEAGGKAAAVQEKLRLRTNAVWIGDTEVDIRAARTLEIDSFAVTCGLRNRDLLAAESPNEICSDITEVAARLKHRRAA